jgi:hypothetical protein
VPFRRIAFRSGAIVAIPLVLAACTGEEAAPSDFATRDSAGVRIVEYGGAPTTAPAFTVSPQPVYRVGDEPGEREFTRIVTGALLSDGAAVVVDGMGNNQELVLLAPGGATTTIARPGRGPAELARAVGIRALGPGSFLVLDYDNQKMMVFENGVLVRSIGTADGPLADAVPLGHQPPKTLLMMSVGVTEATRDGWTQGALMRFDLESHALDTVAAFDRTRRRDRADAIHLFGPYGLASASGTLFVTWRNDIPQVTWRGADGAIRQVLRWKATPSYPTQEHLDAYVDRTSESARAMNPDVPREQIEASLRRQRERFEIDTNEPFPLFSSVRGDGQGGVWLSEYRTDLGAVPDGPAHWTLIAPDGRWLGAVILPDGFRMLDVSGDRVLGVLRDSMDVESVAVFTLTPAQPSS